MKYEVERIRFKSCTKSFFVDFLQKEAEEAADP